MIYSLRVLRTHGLCDNALQVIHRADVVTKFMYGSSAWWDFTSAIAREEVKAFIWRSTYPCWFLHFISRLSISRIM